MTTIPRHKLIALWFVCLALTPILLFAMLVQMVVGDPVRAKSIALLFDRCGNDALGGTIGISISEQVGRALKAGRPWATPAAAVIDALMGQGHCRTAAT